MVRNAPHTDDSITISAAKSTSRPNQCSICSKVFKRAEHCARHELSHTNQRPFACHYCPKVYARKDLQKRHERTLHAELYNASHAADNQQAPSTNSNGTSNQPGSALDSAVASYDAELTPHDLTLYPTTTNETIAPSLEADGHAPFDFDIAGLLPFDPSYHQNGHTESGEPTPKRQRLMNDIEHAHGFPVFTPTATPPQPGAHNALDVSDFLSTDLMLGGATNEFFLHQIMQQYDAPLGSDDIFQPLHHEPAAVDPKLTAGFSPAQTASDSGTDKSDRIRLPMILREKSENPPRLHVDEAGFEALRVDVIDRLGPTETPLPLKNHRELQHILNGYLDCFHRHFPIVHLPSLILSQSSSPLILAMASIGALFRLERLKARTLFNVATKICGTLPTSHSFPSSSNTESPQKSALESLWPLQARILLLLYAALGSDVELIQSEIGRLGGLITDYRARRYSLEIRSRQPNDLQWNEWIEIEGTKRYFCATFICSSLLLLLYDIPPAVTITHDLEFEMLEEEKLWNATSAEQWQALRQAAPSSSRRTIRSVMSDMLAGKSNDSSDGSPYYVSGFTTLIIIHALNMFAWNLSQFRHIHVSPSSDLSGVALTLGRCREVLALAKPDGVESLWNSPQGPLLLNCEAMLRVAYTRLFLSPSMPDGLVLLLNCSAEEIARLLGKFVAAKQERSPLISKVMASMCDAFSVPAKAGYLLVQKTAAISWSVEHAFAGWGCVFLLSKWLHCIDVQSASHPPSDAELDIITQVKNAIEGMNNDYEEGSSLAAAMVRNWAPLMSDVWVWGITTRMGTILQVLAQVYENAAKDARRN